MAYGFYVAQVVDVSTITDNRLKVKVLPHMKDIEDDTKCPLWPSFFRDEQYTGCVGDYVWVICDDEFSSGYIFGLANYNTYSDKVLMDSNNNPNSESSGDQKGIYEKSTDGIDLSIPKELRDTINDASLKSGLVGPSSISLLNAKVTYWDTNCVHFIERSTGGKIIAFSNGTLYVFRPSECLVKIGNNAIKLDSTSVSIAGTEIKLDSGHVGLGKGASLNVMGNDALSGIGSIKSPYVFV